MTENRKKYIVTGGSKGIGKATVRMLLARGHQVWTCAREAASLDELREQLSPEERPRLFTERLDLGDIAAVKVAFEQSVFLQDGLDGLVCNAAYQSLGHAMEQAEEAIDTTYRINILSPILTMQACYPALKERRGAMVYVGSVADSRYHAGFSIYGASKAFMNSFVKHACKDTGPDGVRINVVSPGATATPMMEASLEKVKDTRFIEEIGLRRMASPEEVAETVVFALENGSYLHGADLRVHGGIF
jgi:NAD(P)-dependent dehydrogenase (short-subunit alcohol dehydrogenase family)